MSAEPLREELWKRALAGALTDAEVRPIFMAVRPGKVGSEARVYLEDYPRCCSLRCCSAPSHRPSGSDRARVEGAVVCVRPHPFAWFYVNPNGVARENTPDGHLNAGEIAAADRERQQG